MADADLVLLAVADGVATLTLNRPESLNAWTPAMEARWNELLDQLATDDAVRALVVTGAGRGFCPGADRNALGRRSRRRRTGAGPRPAADVGAPVSEAGHRRSQRRLCRARARARCSAVTCASLRPTPSSRHRSRVSVSRRSSAHRRSSPVWWVAATRSTSCSRVGCSWRRKRTGSGWCSVCSSAASLPGAVRATPPRSPAAAPPGARRDQGPGRRGGSRGAGRVPTWWRRWPTSPRASPR